MAKTTADNKFGNHFCLPPEIVPMFAEPLQGQMCNYYSGYFIFGLGKAGLVQKEFKESGKTQAGRASLITQKFKFLGRDGEMRQQFGKGPVLFHKKFSSRRGIKNTI